MKIPLMGCLIDYLYREWTEQSLRKWQGVKEHKFQVFSETSWRLPGGFLVFHILKMAMCNDISCDMSLNASLLHLH